VSRGAVRAINDERGRRNADEHDARA
jgi:hypothetical protein